MLYQVNDFAGACLLEYGVRCDVFLTVHRVIEGQLVTPDPAAPDGAASIASGRHAGPRGRCSGACAACEKGPLSPRLRDSVTRQARSRVPGAPFVSERTPDFLV